MFSFIGYVLVARRSILPRLARSCRGRCYLRRFLGWPLCRTLDVLRLFAFKLDVRETHPCHEFSALKITFHLFKAADLACHPHRPSPPSPLIPLRFTHFL